MRVIIAVFAGAICCGCYGTGIPYVVRNDPLTPISSADPGLQAAFSEVDITTEPGPPEYGYSSDGTDFTKGYWLRLKARVLVLQSNDVRVAMVQCDLGAASGLLHREVAQRVTKLGIDPSRLVLATTHTHGGPGGFFGDKFMNGHIGARAGFDPQLVKFFADTIANGIEDATSRLKPARISVGHTTVDSKAAANRSESAWQRNFDDGTPVPDQQVDRTLTMLRVDTDEGPAGVWVTYPVHSNSIAAGYSLVHGDIHGLTSRLIKSKLALGEKFVAAVATGAEGDVSPGTHLGEDHGVELTTRVATLISDAAVELFGKLTPVESPTLSLAYEEVSMRGVNTTQGRLCPNAFLGNPQIRGSEEGRGPLPSFLANEGDVKVPRGCSATKTFFGWIFQPLVVDPDDMPDVLPFQVLRIGSETDGILFTTAPGEPTTQVGRNMKRAVKLAAPKWNGEVAVLGLTNSYALYFTTGPEFLSQQYEGGATLYGGHQGTFLAEEAGRLTSKLKLGAVFNGGFDARREFRPGAVVPLIPSGPACDASKWRPLSVKVGDDVRFTWSGSGADETCRHLASVRVECDGAVPLDELGLPHSDEGKSLEVSSCGREWTAKWKPGKTTGTCQFFVSRDGHDVKSEFFTLRAP